MEIAAGAVLAKHRAQGDRVVLLHLTLGEAGHPSVPPSQYAEQKRKEAHAAAKALGAEVLFGPYKDSELRYSGETATYLAGVIRNVKPTHVITHWRNSIHQDHAAAHEIVRDGVLRAAVSGQRSVRSVYYTDNWEDAEGFTPYIIVDVTKHMDRWRECVRQYEFIRGGVFRFPYFEYYEALATVRGAVAGKSKAVAFDIDAFGKRRVVEALQ
jgi:LmbE family N-acetylglucosaminyl deacetylase